MHYNLLHLYVWILIWQSQPCWSQTFLPARIKILLWYRWNIVERWKTRWHIIVSARYPDRRTYRQTDRHTSPVLIVKVAVNIRPSQHNFGIPKQISEVWDFILYFYVFHWLVNQQHITSGIPKRLVLNSFEKSRRADQRFELWNLCFCERQGFFVFSRERSGFEFTSYIFVLQLKNVGFGRWVLIYKRSYKVSWRVYTFILYLNNIGTGLFQNIKNKIKYRINITMSQTQIQQAIK